MFGKKKTITLSTINFDADDDKLIIILKNSAMLSPKQVEELANTFENIEGNKSVIIPDVIKEITVLKKYGKKK